VNIQTHEQLKSHIWEIANRLRGPYRPPQYRLVMLPIVVLRRLDCVLEPTKDAVLKQYKKLTAQNMPESAMQRLLGRAADPTRKHPLYNTSPFTFQRLLGDAENIAPNLVSYINGFSVTARSIFDRFKFNDQIEKLDASNRASCSLLTSSPKQCPTPLREMAWRFCRLSTRTRSCRYHRRGAFLSRPRLRLPGDGLGHDDLAHCQA
jgi:type I restriction-modification system DNA methylase subunit